VNKFKQLFKWFALGCAFLIFTPNVMALPYISGTLEMTGAFYTVDSRGNPINAAAASGIDFSLFGSDMFRVTASDGDFSGLTGQLGNITDFQFDPFVAPIANFWSIDIFSFELTDVSRGFSNDMDSFLVLNGVGTISAAGFEDTDVSWLLSAGSSGGGIFSWSASAVVKNVPEPSVLALLSIGLIGLGIRKKI